MSIDKSLKRKNSLARSRNVMTRAERILKLEADGRFLEGRSPFGLPKVRAEKIKAGKKKVKKEAEEAAAPAKGGKKK